MRRPVTPSRWFTILPAPLPHCEAIRCMKIILLTLDQIAKRTDGKEESGHPAVEVETHGNTL